MFHPSPLESRAILQLFGRIAKFKPTLSRNCSSLVRGLEGRLSGSDIGKRYFSHPIRATRPLREDATATEEALVSEENIFFEDEIEVFDMGDNTVNISESKILLGIDPDLSGAMAVINSTDENELDSIEVFDVPTIQTTIGGKLRRKHDPVMMAKILKDLNAPKGTLAFIEHSVPFPSNGKMSWFGAGYGYGIWVGVLSALEFRVIPVTARRWKFDWAISGKAFSKDDSRTLATSLFPSLEGKLKRKKDHGRADAVLIAAWGKGHRPNPRGF